MPIILGVRRAIGAKTSTLIPNWNSKKVADQGVYIAGIKLNSKDGLSISCRKDEQAKKLFDFLQFLGLKSISLDRHFKYADKEYGSFNGQVKIKDDIEIFCYVIAVCEFNYGDVEDLYRVSNMMKEYQNIIKQYKGAIENYIAMFKTEHINKLPEDLIALIKERLSFKDKIQLSMVNKRFNQYFVEGEFHTENDLHNFKSISRTAPIFLSEEMKLLEGPEAIKKVILYRPNGQGILCQAYIVPNAEDETNNKLFVNKNFFLTQKGLEAIEKFCKKHNLLKSHYYRYDAEYSLFDKDNDNNKPEYKNSGAKYQVITVQEELEFLQTASKIKEAIDKIYINNSTKKSVEFFNINNNNVPSNIHVAYEKFKQGFTMAIHKTALINNLNVFISVLQNEKDPSAKNLLTECENYYQQLKSSIPAQQVLEK